jgi:predicted PurR-regulated permease PerM
MNKTLDSVILRYAGFGLVFLGVAYLLYLVRGALPVFVTGGVLAYALEPILQRLEKRGYSRAGAVGLVFLFFLLIFLILLGLAAAAWQQVQVLNTNFQDLSEKLTKLVESNVDRVQHAKLPQGIKDSIIEGVNNWLASLRKQAPGYLTNLIQYFVGSVGTILITVVLLPIVTYGFMMQANQLRARILMLVPPQYRRDVTDIAASINELLGHYVRGQLIVCSTYGVLCTIAFEILSHVYKLQYPLVLGALAATIYIIPYVGMGTITASAGLTAYFTAEQPVPCAVAAVGCCLVFNLIVDYGISPRVLGRGVGLHPLMVIFALLSGNQLGGPLGMIFAVPLFASLRVIAIYLFPQLAAPLPEDSPAVTAPPDRSAESELIKTTRDAEAKSMPAAETR